MTRYFYITGLASIMFLAINVLNASAEEKKPSTLLSAEKLLSHDNDIRLKEQQRILQERAELALQLGEMIKKNAHAKNTFRAPIKEAINLLGELRMKESIEVLVNHIGYPDVTYPDMIFHDPNHFGLPNNPRVGRSLPAVDALVKIGPDVVMPVARKLAATKSHVEYNACETVLERVHSPYFPLSVPNALKWASHNASDQEKRNRIEETRKKFPPVADAPNHYPPPKNTATAFEK